MANYIVVLWWSRSIMWYKAIGLTCQIEATWGRRAAGQPWWSVFVFLVVGCVCWCTSGHIIFDVKMDITRKACWVKDGHNTPDSLTFSFAGVGGPAQDLPKFQMPCLTPKSVQTCLIYSSDGDHKVSLKKFDPFMTNGCPWVSLPAVTSDWLMTYSWLAVYCLLVHILCTQSNQ